MQQILWPLGRGKRRQHFDQPLRSQIRGRQNLGQHCDAHAAQHGPSQRFRIVERFGWPAIFLINVGLFGSMVRPELNHLAEGFASRCDSGRCGDAFEPPEHSHGPQDIWMRCTDYARHNASRRQARNVLGDRRVDRFGGEGVVCIAPLAETTRRNR
ncbi:hypothetical protein OKW45_007353 [Paraburkholderia sp. WSM4175]